MSLFGGDHSELLSSLITKVKSEVPEAIYSHATQMNLADTALAGVIQQAVTALAGSLLPSGALGGALGQKAASLLGGMSSLLGAAESLGGARPPSPLSGVDLRVRDAAGGDVLARAYQHASVSGHDEVAFDGPTRTLHEEREVQRRPDIVRIVRARDHVDGVSLRRVQDVVDRRLRAERHAVAAFERQHRLGSSQCRVIHRSRIAEQSRRIGGGERCSRAVLAGGTRDTDGDGGRGASRGRGVREARLSTLTAPAVKPVLLWRQIMLPLTLTFRQQNPNPETGSPFGQSFLWP